MRTYLKLGRIAGIPLSAHYSWFIVLALIAFTLSQLFQDRHPEWSTVALWTTAILTSIAFFLSILAHELSHSIVALRHGIPVKGITLFIFGGISHISREAPTPKAELLITIVGPLCSFGLGTALISLALIINDLDPYLRTSALWIGGCNLSLGIFNMLPGFPLDGGRVLRSAMWWLTGNYWRATHIATRAGQLTALLIVISGIVFFINGAGMGIWTSLIGAYLFMASSSSHKQFLFQKRLDLIKAGQLMSTSVSTIATSVTLQTVDNEGLIPNGEQFCLVHENGKCLGVIVPSAIAGIQYEKFPYIMAESVMISIKDIPSVGINDNAFGVLEMIEGYDHRLAIVRDGETVVGLISSESVKLRIGTRTRSHSPREGHAGPT